MRLHVPAALRVALAGGLALIGLQIPLSAPAEATATGPFSCVPKFYQVSATGGGAFYEYNAASNSLSRVGTGAVSNLNAIGYRTADNYIYGVSGTKLYRIDAYGNINTGTTVTGVAPATSGGDFYAGKLVTAGSGNNNWTAIDVDTAVATAYTMTGAANGFASSGTWAALDLTVQGDVAYGLSGTTLYIAKMDTKQISTRTVTGTSAGSYGAAYSDTSGNAFFYNNSDNKVYMFTAAELAKATGSATAPSAVLVGGAASTPALTAPNDGASCPNAVSPYVPGIDDESTDAVVEGTDVTLGGSVNPNNTLTSVEFCFGTDPALVGCTTVSATPGTISGNVSQPFAGEVTELLPGTYYYRVVATNAVGTNTGEIKSFVIAGGDPDPIAQTITFDPMDDVVFGDTVADAAATASSGLPVTFTSSTPQVCIVDSDGTDVAALSAGTCELVADQAGDATYAAAAPVSQSFEVSKAAQTVHLAAVPDIKVDRGPATVTVTTSRPVVPTVESLTPQVCTVGAAGAVNLVTSGTCTVRASVAEDETHTGATDSVSFRVLPALVVTAPAPVATPTGGSVDITVPPTGGVGPYTWAVTASAGNRLPAGLTLDSATGRITGTPTRPGEYTVQITVTDAEGEQVVRSLRVVVASKLTGDAPSGRRTVVAGGTFSLPDLSDEITTWSYRLPSTLHRVRTADGELVLRADAKQSGRYDVPLTITDGVGTQAGAFHVTVLPQRVRVGGYHLEDGLVSELDWKPVVGAEGYRVYVDGRLVGRPTAPYLSLAQPLGPKSTVTVRAVAEGGLLSAPRELRYAGGVKPGRAAVATVVRFDTDLAALDRGDRKVLRALVGAVRDGGFRHVRLTGYTDARGTGAHNLGLSKRRALTVRGFLRDRLHGVDLTWQGRAAQSPAASNATTDGMALNRRVELRVW